MCKFCFFQKTRRHGKPSISLNGNARTATRTRPARQAVSGGNPLPLPHFTSIAAAERLALDRPNRHRHGDADAADASRGVRRGFAHREGSFGSRCIAIRVVRVSGAAARRPSSQLGQDARPSCFAIDVDDACFEEEGGCRGAMVCSSANEIVKAQIRKFFGADATPPRSPARCSPRARGHNVPRLLARPILS